MPDESVLSPGLRGFRFTVRELMIVVLVVAAGLGWLAHLGRQARIQRDAVAAVGRLGGLVAYDWQFENGKLRVKPGTSTVLNEVPGWPKWLVDRLGVDAFGSVTDVSIRRMSVRTGDWRASIGRGSAEELEGLASLENLMLNGTEITNAGLLNLTGLTWLKELWLLDTWITASGEEELRRALPNVAIQHSVRRASGDARDYRAANGDLAASSAVSEGGGKAGAVHEQSAPDRTSSSWI